MHDLLNLVLDAHGGLPLWQEAQTIRAKGSIGGLLWPMRSQEGILATADMTVDVQRQRLVHEDFTAPGLRGVYTPDRVTIEKRDGEVVAERTAPRRSFADHGPNTPWDQLHALYFSGCAMWNYLTAPYLLTRPGVALKELEPQAQEDGTTWRRLRASFPDDIATHNTEQVFYYDSDGLLRRHDYAPDILGRPSASHFTERHITASGLVFPTHRYVVPAQEDGSALKEPVLISIDLTDITVI